MLVKAYKTLGLLRRSFSGSLNHPAKKTLYLTLVLPQLKYCSQIWQPHLLKDIMKLEQIQRRVLNIFLMISYSSDYKSRLVHLRILPLMMQLELHDIMFFLRCLKKPCVSFPLSSFVTFSSNSTRSSTHLKLQHTWSRSNSISHFYFNRLPRLWNSLPAIDLELSIPAIKKKVQLFLWDHFICSFESNNPCSFHFKCPCTKCLCPSTAFITLWLLDFSNSPSVHCPSPHHHFTSLLFSVL